MDRAATRARTQLIPVITGKKTTLTALAVDNIECPRRVSLLADVEVTYPFERTDTSRRREPQVQPKRQFREYPPATLVANHKPPEQNHDSTDHQNKQELRHTLYTHCYAEAIRQNSPNNATKGSLLY